MAFCATVKYVMFGSQEIHLDSHFWFETFFIVTIHNHLKWFLFRILKIQEMQTMQFDRWIMQTILEEGMYLPNAYNKRMFQLCVEFESS